MNEYLQAFLPNRAISKRVAQVLLAAEIAIFLAVWAFYPATFFPKPQAVLSAFLDLWNEQGLGVELIASLTLNIEALILASAISLVLAYSSVIPAFRPIVAFIGKLRFLSMIGLSFFFVLATHNGHELKVSILTFAVTVFFVVGMADVVASVPKESFDLARTLRMSEWRVVWEVIVLGQADKAFDQLRMNAAMSWMMLSLVESISREGGGIGTLLLDQNKHFHLDAVFAIQITILLLGLGQDWAIGAARKMLCPYADLMLERK